MSAFCRLKIIICTSGANIHLRHAQQGFSPAKKQICFYLHCSNGHTGTLYIKQLCKYVQKSLKLERAASGLLCHLLLLFASLVTVIAKLLQVSSHKILFLKNSAANRGDCTLFLFIKIKHTFKC